MKQKTFFIVFLGLSFGKKKKKKFDKKQRTQALSLTIYLQTRKKVKNCIN